jgi:hypothetical protein
MTDSSKSKTINVAEKKLSFLIDFLTDLGKTKEGDSFLMSINSKILHLAGIIQQVIFFMIKSKSHVNKNFYDIFDSYCNFISEISNGGTIGDYENFLENPQEFAKLLDGAAREEYLKEFEGVNTEDALADDFLDWMGNNEDLIRKIISKETEVEKIFLDQYLLNFPTDEEINIFISTYRIAFDEELTEESYKKFLKHSITLLCFLLMLRDEKIEDDVIEVIEDTFFYIISNGNRLIGKHLIQNNERQKNYLKNSKKSKDKEERKEKLKKIFEKHEGKIDRSFFNSATKKLDMSEKTIRNYLKEIQSRS